MPSNDGTQSYSALSNRLLVKKAYIQTSGVFWHFSVIFYCYDQASSSCLKEIFVSQSKQTAITMTIAARRSIKNLVLSNCYLHAFFLRWKWNLKGPKERDLRFLTQLNFRDFVDVGVNVGEYSFFISYVAENIYGFEPNPKCLKVLKALAIPKLRVFPFGLSDVDGTIEIHIPVGEEGENASLGSIRPPNSPELRSVSYPIQIRRFSETEASKSKNVDLIKIDVEGAELEVLKGMKDFLIENDPLCILEIEERRNPEWPVIFETMRSFGYAPYATFDGKILEPVSDNYIDAQKLSQSDRRFIFNFFFMKPSRRQTLSNYVTEPT